MEDEHVCSGVSWFSSIVTWAF